MWSVAAVSTLCRLARHHLSSPARFLAVHPIRIDRTRSMVPGRYLAGTTPYLALFFALLFRSQASLRAKISRHVCPPRALFCTEDLPSGNRKACQFQAQWFLPCFGSLQIQVLSLQTIRQKQQMPTKHLNSRFQWLDQCNSSLGSLSWC